MATVLPAIQVCLLHTLNTKDKIMKISILSDLHVDFAIQQVDPNRIKDHMVYDAYCDHLDVGPETEVLIVAGDVGHYNAQDFVVLAAMGRVFSYKKIFVVAGNHTLYRSSKHSSAKRISEFWSYEDQNGVIEVLNGNVVEYKGVRFGGAMGFAYGLPYMNKTLGLNMTSDESIQMYDSYMNDMYCIDGLTDPKDMYDVELEKLLDVYQDVDVMISHYNPTIKKEGIAEMYREDPSTGFYCMDCEDLLMETSATHWIYGHQHATIDYECQGVSVLCNAFGYPSESQHSGKLTIEV